MKKIPYARVQWWDDQDVVVACPYCKSWHRHFVTKATLSVWCEPLPVGQLLEYDQKSQRLAPCVPELDAVYTLDFPLLGYEIEKPWESKDPNFVGESTKARFLGAEYVSKDVPWKKDWRNDAPFRYLGTDRVSADSPTWPNWWYHLEELEIAEQELHCSRSAAEKSGALLAVSDSQLLPRNDVYREVLRKELRQRELGLQGAKRRHKIALAGLMAPKDTFGKRGDPNVESLMTLRNVVKATRNACDEYRWLLVKCRPEPIPMAAETKQVQGINDLNAVAERLKGLSVTKDTASASVLESENVENQAEIDEDIVEVKALVQKLLNRVTVGLLRRGRFFETLPLTSGNDNTPLTSMDGTSRSLVGQAFDIADDVGCPFSATDVDARNIENGWEWTEGQYNASHVEPKAVAYFVRRHVFLLKERDEKHPLYKLWKAIPPGDMPTATIYVNKPICHSCQAFIDKVNSALGTDIVPMHVPCEAVTTTLTKHNVSIAATNVAGSLTSYENVSHVSFGSPVLAVKPIPPLKQRSNIEISDTFDIMDQLTLGFGGMSVNMSPAAESQSRPLLGGHRRSSLSAAPVVCYNCGSSAHYSPKCPLPRSSWQERKKHKAEADRQQEAWRRSIDDQDSTPTEEVDIFQDSELPTQASPQTPTRRQSTTQEWGFTSTIYVATGSPRSPRRPIVCYNCGIAGHVSTACRSPKASREQQSIYIAERQRQHADWTRRMSEQLRAFEEPDDDDDDDDHRTGETQSMSSEGRPRRLFGSG